MSLYDCITPEGLSMGVACPTIEMAEAMMGASAESENETVRIARLSEAVIAAAHQQHDLRLLQEKISA